MKILLMIGSHPRHRFLARLLHKNGILDALIVENREEFVPIPPSGLDLQTKEFFQLHFERRRIAESEIFGTDSRKITLENRLDIGAGEINSKKVLEFLRVQKPDVVITFGAGLLGKEFLAVAPMELWNLHGGLSPWYKGAITHFWPSYLLEPQFTGCTIHYINSRIDAGAIIHQSPAVLERGDGLQQLSSKSMKLGMEEIVPLLNLFKKNGNLASKIQTKTGKLWLKKDWKPAHLNLIYGLFQDKIVDEFLDGQFEKEPPTLFRQTFL